MKLSGVVTTPAEKKYDVVVVGGASMGVSVAWYLSHNVDFKGSILVVERDVSYQWASSTHSNDCMRQQFATDINIKIAQYAAEYVKDFRANMGGSPEIPNLPIRNFGYLYLAGDHELADVLVRDQKTQASLGAGTQIVSNEDINQQYPFYNLDDVVLGSLNTVDEGHFDAPAMVNWWRRKSAENGVEYIQNEVVAMDASAQRVNSVTLKSGEVIEAKTVVNAAGPRARQVAKMAGVDLPIEPRRRYTFLFTAKQPLDRDLPLTIDPSGVHFRTCGDQYLVGCPPLDGDPGIDYDDFMFEDGIWEKKLLPILRHRIPQFSEITVTDSWVGHYEFNTFDHNAIVGKHSTISNLVFMNGFSGHGSQQAPAMGRGVAELITYGEYQTLDLSPFSFSRLERNEPLMERAVI